MKKILFAMSAAVAVSAAIFAFNANSTAQVPDTAQAEIAALKKEIAALKKEAYHPELGDQMLGLQMRHARLWSAGEAQNWLLAAFELQELKEAFDGVVEQNPDHATFQPQRLADILPAMTKGPVTALRDAIDHNNKTEFEKAYDGLSAACSGCHRVAGNDFLVIQRPTTPMLDNLRAMPPKPTK